MTPVLPFGHRPTSSRVRPSREPWLEADPDAIARALAHASAKPTGGWAVLDATKRIVAPRRFVVASTPLVAWPTDAGVRVGPEACPHMGANLAEGAVDRSGRIVCPWHGLPLGDRPRADWSPCASFDDGVLTWVRLPALRRPNEQALPEPIRAERPTEGIDAVIRMTARCDPRDVLANRLDPWHGRHYHPHAFLRLSTVSDDEAQVTVRVVYRVLGPLGVEVDARFWCPDARTIVMKIVDGDGLGSIVSTHATPIEEGRTAIVEAIRATSDRRGFRIARGLSRLVRPLIERRARALWEEDRAYAERLYLLREKSEAITPRGGTE